jgi:hypothetical protein
VEARGSQVNSRTSLTKQDIVSKKSKGCVQSSSVEHLHRMHKSLGSMPRTAPKVKKQVKGRSKEGSKSGWEKGRE